MRRNWKTGQAIKRMLHMFKVKDCRHVCLFCEYFDMCKEDYEVNEMNLKYAMRSEDTEQIAVIQWAQYNMNHHPELKWLFHCPNGGSRNQKEAVKLKQMGVKAGVSDLCLPYPKGIYCGLFIEMKFGDNRQQASQKEFLKDMTEAGHFVATCYSTEEAIGVITEYLNLKDATFGDSYAEFLEQFGCRPEEVGQKMKIPNNSILKDGKVKGGGGSR